MGPKVKTKPYKAMKVELDLVGPGGGALIRSGRKIREGRGMNVTSMSYASMKLPKVSLK